MLIIYLVGHCSKVAKLNSYVNADVFESLCHVRISIFEVLRICRID